MDTTVKQLAQQLGLVNTINRAFSFHHKLESNPDLIWNMPVRFSDRLQTSAGYFHGREMWISLHPALQKLQGDLVATLLHEVAHAHQWIVYGRVDHGATWWEMMHQLGELPRRTHDIAACKPLAKVSPKNLDDMDL